MTIGETGVPVEPRRPRMSTEELDASHGCVWRNRRHSARRESRAAAIRVWKVPRGRRERGLPQFSEVNTLKRDPSWAHEQRIKAFLDTVRSGRTGASEEASDAVQGIELMSRTRLGLDPDCY